ncbi:MAG: RsmE family RNA methyltransferase [Candidatus Eisenbacteria bacterium]|nr:RsmE family RNA methyltransferase [Candidatus Eisenbacteria bacterium]
MPEDERLRPYSWRMDTFMVPPGALQGRAVTLSGAEARHAFAAARVREGDRVRLIDGEGAEAVAAVRRVRGGEASLVVVDRRTRTRDEGVTLTVAQSIPKGRGMDEVVRRCAELGVASIVPVTTERTVVRLRGDSAERRVGRWRSVAVAATKQSRGVFVTSVAEPADLSGLRPMLGASDLAVVAWEEEGGVTLREALRGEVPRDIVAVVGPEGGLSETEIASLGEAGAVPVTLGSRVLRSDWAAAALAAAVSYELGGLLP